MVIKFSGFAEIFTFSSPALMVSVLAVIVLIKLTQCANVYAVIYRKKSVTLIIVYNKKKIQIFGMNMPFISSREARKCIFHSWLRHS